MTFHRYVAPTYYNPTGIDYLNDPVANGFSLSVPVVVDSIKSGGPNEGIYLVAFGEDASSANANRGIKALAENTDALDDMLHRSIAVPSRSGNVTAPSPVSSIILPANTFVGDSGGYSLDRLFSILDSNGNEIIDASGVKVVVASITGAAIGSGFSSGSVTLTLNVPIPTSTVYYVQYAVRGNLADLPVDALTNVSIQASQEVSAAIENQFRLLQGNGYVWNHAWEGNNTIYNITWLGLNGLYSKATTRVSPTLSAYLGDYTDTLDTPGAGAYFARSGPGMLGYSAVDSNTYADLYSDPLGAIWKATVLDTFDGNYTGLGTILSTQPMSETIGFAYLGSRVTDGSQSTIHGGGTPPGFAAFFAGSLTDTVNNTSDLYTRIYSGTTCTLAEASSKLRVTLVGTDSYFSSGTPGSLKSAIAAGYDMLLVRQNSSGQVRALIITNVQSATVVDTLCLDGGLDATFVGACTILKWVRSYFMVGDGATQFREIASDLTSEVGLRNFQVLQPPINTDTQNTEDTNSTSANAYFGAHNATAAGQAIAWGGYSLNGVSGQGTYSFTGTLRGDGSVYATYAVAAAYTQPARIAASGSTPLDVSLGTFSEYVLDATVVGNLTINFTDMRAHADYFVVIRRVPSVGYNSGQQVIFTCTDVNGLTYVISHEGGGGGLSTDSSAITLSPVTNCEVMDVFRIRLIALNGGGRRAIITRNTVAG